MRIIVVVIIRNILVMLNHTISALMAEWLRRLTRNQMASSRTGSSPADCDFVHIFVSKRKRVYRIVGAHLKHLSYVEFLFTAVMAEWLRRLTRNQMGSSRAGSNPADCDFVHIFELSVNASYDIRVCDQSEHFSYVDYPISAVMAESG